MIVFQIIGVAVSFMAGCALLVVIVYAAKLWWHGPTGPSFHIGAPSLRGELAFYERGRILTAKGGGRITEPAAPRLDHSFDVPWWCGIATNKGHFFFGFMRLRRKGE